ATEESMVKFSVDTFFTARSLTLYPAQRDMSLDVALAVERNGGFRLVESFRVARSNNSLNVGFDPYAPVVVSFEAVRGKQFRVRFSDISGDAGVTEIEIAAYPKMERFKEKTLAKMHQ